MLTAMSGSTSCSAPRNPAHHSTSWPRPTETKSQDAFCGQALSVYLPPKGTIPGASGGTRPKRSSRTPLIFAASLMRVSLAAALKTRPPSDFTARVGSMPCQNRWLGSSSAPMCVLLISVASRSIVAGL